MKGTKRTDLLFSCLFLFELACSDILTLPYPTAGGVNQLSVSSAIWHGQAPTVTVEGVLCSNVILINSNTVNCTLASNLTTIQPAIVFQESDGNVITKTGQYGESLVFIRMS